MTDQHHLNLLRRGIDAWNEWRASHPHVLDLHEAEQDRLDLVKQGKDAWHQWRQEHPDVQPDLRGITIFFRVKHTLTRVQRNESLI